MGPERWRTPKGIALSNNPTAPPAHAALTNTLQHLRHALRCAGRAIPDLGEGTPAALRGGELCADVAAAARSCANLLDHLDGYAGGSPGHPAGVAL